MHSYRIRRHALALGHGVDVVIGTADSSSATIYSFKQLRNESEIVTSCRLKVEIVFLKYYIRYISTL